MESSKVKIVSIFLVVVNVVAMFFLFAMPKLYISKYHFVGYKLYRRYDSMFSVVKSVTVKTMDGGDVNLVPGDEIWSEEGYSGEIIYVEDGRIDPASVDLQNTEFYEDITEKAKAEDQAEWIRKNEEGEKEFARYMKRQRFWFLYPSEYSRQFIVGSIVALASSIFGVSFCILTSKKIRVRLIVLSILFGVEILGIAYFLLFPSFCK